MALIPSIPEAHIRQNSMKKKTITKKCTKCGIEKSIDDFYKDSRGKGYYGRYAKCKKCHNEINIQGKTYRKTKRKNQRKYNLNPKNRIKLHARYLANRAKHKGIIKPSHCEKCDNPNFDLHHPDYTKPLYVIALCKQHHSDIHNKSL